VSKRVKAKFQFENVSLFSFETPEKEKKFPTPTQNSLKIPSKTTPPHHNGNKLYCEKLYECFLVFSDVVNCGQSASRIAPFIGA